MKTLPAFLIAAAITMCSMLAAGRPNTSAAEAQPLQSRDSKAKESSMAQEIVAKEREGLEALKSDHPEAFGKLMAEEAMFVDARGPASKAQVMRNVAGLTLTEYTMEEAQILPLTSKSGLIMYKMNEKGNSHGKEFDAQVYVSSIWEKRGKDWVCLFSQETAAK